MHVRELRMMVEIASGGFINDPDARAMAVAEAARQHPGWKDWRVDDLHYVNGAAFVTVVSKVPA